MEINTEIMPGQLDAEGQAKIPGLAGFFDEPMQQSEQTIKKPDKAGQKKQQDYKKEAEFLAGCIIEPLKKARLNDPEAKLDDKIKKYYIDSFNVVMNKYDGLDLFKKYPEIVLAGSTGALIIDSAIGFDNLLVILGDKIPGLQALKVNSDEGK